MSLALREELSGVPEPECHTLRWCVVSTGLGVKTLENNSAKHQVLQLSQAFSIVQPSSFGAWSMPLRPAGRLVLIKIFDRFSQAIEEAPS